MSISLQSSVDNPMDENCNSKWKFMKVLEDGCYPETSAKIGKQNFKLYTWSQFLQENEFLHNVFNFIPKTQQSGNKLYVSEREEVNF